MKILKLTNADYGNEIIINFTMIESIEPCESGCTLAMQSGAILKVKETVDYVLETIAKMYEFH